MLSIATTASSKAGFLPLLFWLIVVGGLAIRTACSLRGEVDALLRKSSAAQRPVAAATPAALARLMMFLSVCVSSVGALTAYMTGSGKLLHSLFGISPTKRQHFIPAAEVLSWPEGDWPGRDLSVSAWSS